MSGVGLGEGQLLPPVDEEACPVELGRDAAGFGVHLDRPQVVVRSLLIDGEGIQQGVARALEVVAKTDEVVSHPAGVHDEEEAVDDVATWLLPKAEVHTVHEVDVAQVRWQQMDQLVGDGLKEVGEVMLLVLVL